ncbi:hypothetical protein [Pseudomonas sp. BF-R-24]|uniref:hypothetical protein n=1 Tax=Pseudomonas sp. BF-R-24 TaxID=2832386 RepID=UPI002958C102|nr:hypothetical protein [Pseudomonas sp. BF-R-24]
MMNLRIQQPFTSKPRRQEGSVSVLMVIALAAMAMMAAVCDIDDSMIRQRAILNAEGDEGTSQLIGDLAIGHLTLTYLDVNGAEVTNPATSGFRAIRYVRLSLEDFVFNLFIPGFGVRITLPAFRATLPRESLGRHSGSGEITPC